MALVDDGDCPSPLAGESFGSTMPPAWSEQRGALFTRNWARCRRQWESEGIERLKLFAAQMRRNPTEAERRLWSMLRDRRLDAYKFRRQVVIAPYIVDFVCFERRVIVEADGSQHFDNDYDARRDAWLRGQDFAVCRFWNSDILARPGRVAEALFLALPTPHPPTASRRAPPSPARGEGLGRIDA